MRNRKYNKENLTEISKMVNSFSQMMKYFNISSGSARTNMIKRCKEYNIDTSHFTTSVDNLKKYSGQHRKTPDYFFNKSGNVHAYLLRRSLIESGVEYICVWCGNNGNWNGKSITLQVDHIDGDNGNNLKSNLRFLCPNCHSQTETWGYQSVKTVF